MDTHERAASRSRLIAAKLLRVASNHLYHALIANPKLKSLALACLVVVTHPVAAKPVPAGALAAATVEFELAVYYLPAPPKNPIDSFRAAVASRAPAFRIVEEIPGSQKGSFTSARVEDDVPANYAPPDLSFLRYFGRGISREQAEALQGSKQALILGFAYQTGGSWRDVRIAYEIAEAVARDTEGLLWDEQTREVFSPDKWHESRLAAWDDAAPDASANTVIHAYNSGEFVRAITLGMAKFGMPDLVINGTSWADNRAVGNLVNAVCQRMVEGVPVEKNGEFPVDLRAIRNKDVLKAQTSQLMPNASGSTVLQLRIGEWEDGDPYNRLAEIHFPKTQGRDEHAARSEVLSSLYGWEDAVSRVQHTNELLAASQRAKARLPAVRAAFLSGLAPGEYIEVKAPFATPSGDQEWMWVEVTAWSDAQISGLLKNEPFNIPTLHGGQAVEVNQGEVFDYVWVHADGKREGNETSTIIRRMQEANGQL